MEIRTMAISDYNAAYTLWTNTAGMGMRSLDDSPEGIEKFLRRNPTTNFVAVHDRKIVGIFLSGHDGRRGYIYHVAVDSALRNRGIGNTLLERALEALKREGINKAALVVFKDNKIGNSFWDKRGFETRRDLNYRNKSLNDMNI